MRELTITEQKSKAISKQMWSIVEPYMTVEDIEFTRSYRDADEWEILMALLAIICIDENIQMPYDAWIYVNHDILSAEQREKVKNLAILDKPKHTTLTQEEFDDLLKTLPEEPWE